MDSLYDKLANGSGLIHYDPAFIDYIEMHMADLRMVSIKEGLFLDISDIDKVRADRNFNLLCNLAGIPHYLHWITMRVNKLTAASEFSYKTPVVYIVSSNYLAELILKFDESQTII